MFSNSNLCHMYGIKLENPYNEEYLFCHSFIEFQVKI